MKSLSFASKKAPLIAVLVFLASGCATNHQSIGLGNPGGAETGTEADSSFAQEACQTTAMEKEIGRLAETNTRNKELRAFARRLSSDHARAQKELSQLSDRHGTDHDRSVEAPLQAAYDRLATLKGGEFDQAFKDEVIREHERAIGAFERQAASGANPALRAFAEKHLPDLRMHLDQARSLPVRNDLQPPKPEGGYEAAFGSPVFRGIAR
jgi:putative membrane protein